MTRLLRLEAAAEEELGALHRDLLDPPAHDGRPHVALNFVMTADGRVSYRGRAEIGTRTDRELMFHLRSLADAVMVGAGTVRADPFAPTVKDRERQPLAVVVSRSAELPFNNRFFRFAGPPLLAALRERGIRFLLCEGGPTLAGELLAGGLVDELFLTHATLVTAEPGARRLFEGQQRPSGVVRLERVSLHASDSGEWYERSLVRYLS